mmetsp:Transcript_78924/g.211963  ORF Transcript_78924/g.211963 Transcript_78924/m.211963 type:complete len:539 (+) Transcript_78924:26-1642(+)
MTNEFRRAHRRQAGRPRTSEGGEDDQADQHDEQGAVGHQPVVPVEAHGVLQGPALERGGPPVGLGPLAAGGPAAPPAVRPRKLPGEGRGELRQLELLLLCATGRAHGAHPAPFQDAVQQDNGVSLLRGTPEAARCGRGVLQGLHHDPGHRQQRHGQQHARHAPDLIEKPDAQDHDHRMDLHGDAEEDRLHEEVHTEVHARLAREGQADLRRSLPHVNDGQDARQRRGNGGADAGQEVGQEGQEAERGGQIEPTGPEGDGHGEAGEGGDEALHLHVARGGLEGIFGKRAALHLDGAPQHIDEEDEGDDRLQCRIEHALGHNSADILDLCNQPVEELVVVERLDVHRVNVRSKPPLQSVGALLVELDVVRDRHTRSDEHPGSKPQRAPCEENAEEDGDRQQRLLDERRRLRHLLRVLRRGGVLRGRVLREPSVQVGGHGGALEAPLGSAGNAGELQTGLQPERVEGFHRQPLENSHDKHLQGVQDHHAEDREDEREQHLGEGAEKLDAQVGGREADRELDEVEALHLLRHVPGVEALLSG